MKQANNDGQPWSHWGWETLVLCACAAVTELGIPAGAGKGHCSGQERLSWGAEETG